MFWINFFLFCLNCGKDCMFLEFYFFYFKWFRLLGKRVWNNRYREIISSLFKVREGLVRMRNL